ncbi:MAG: lipid A biosynthesis acyltransferase [Motiliproteus sp.]
MSRPATHWSKASETGTILGMRILLLVHRFFGRRGFRFLLFPLILYYYLSQPVARDSSKQYLQLLLPYISPEKRTELSSFRHFMMFGEVLLDKFLAWMGRIGKNDIVLETASEFAQLGKDGKGGVIVVSHLGNTEICGALAQSLPNIRLTALVYTLHSEKFNTLVDKVNKNSQIEMMQVTEISPATAMILSERVAAGEYIVIAGDRTPVTGQSRISLVRFLGKLAPMPQGAFILAGLLKCPVYLMFCLKAKSKYHIYLERFSGRIEFSRKLREQAINTAVQQYAERLEYYCIKAPLQWFNFFPYWRDSVEVPAQSSS